MQIIDLPEVDSTNSFLALIAPDSPSGIVVLGRAQTAGRGQRGNSWEAAPGENITMSMLLRPAHIAPAGQFVISQAVSVGIVNVLKRYLPNSTVSVKWPNDIYVDDRKICGILIENTLSGGSIDYSIVGMGINVNQREFLSDAPNPVSIYQLTDREHDIDVLVREVAEEILALFAEVDADHSNQTEGSTHLSLQERYFGMLWRSDGYYPYHDNIRDMNIMAAIESVAPSGHITLVTMDGERYVYAFKEISSILNGGEI